MSVMNKKFAVICDLMNQKDYKCTQKTSKEVELERTQDGKPGKPLLDKNGKPRTKIVKRFHSYDDQPAVVMNDGTKYWYTDGVLTRDNDKPTVIFADGSKEWRLNGKLHRENDQPAVILANGTTFWYKNGKRHRIGAPAVEYSNGTKEWYIDDLLNRPEKDEKGFFLPTIVRADGTRMWHQKGRLYRDELDENGKFLPAVIFPDGTFSVYNDKGDPKNYEYLSVQGE